MEPKTMGEEAPGLSDVGATQRDEPGKRAVGAGSRPRLLRSRWHPGERPELVLVPSVFVVAVLAWQFVPDWLGVDPIVLPRPAAVAASCWELLTGELLWPNLWVTVQEAGLGFLFGGASAFVLGGLISQSRLAEKALMPYVFAFQSVPKIALAPLFVLWFGFGISSKVVTAMVLAFFPIFINVVEGLKSSSSGQVEMLRVFGASRLQIFRLVRLPNAVPFIFAGLDMGIVFAILGAIVGEFIGAQGGLGYLLLQANYGLDIAGLFGVLVILSALGTLGHWAVRLFQRLVAPWSRGDRLISA